MMFSAGSGVSLTSRCAGSGPGQQTAAHPDTGLGAALLSTQTQLLRHVNSFQPIFLFLFAESVLCVFSGLKDVFCPVKCRNKLIDTKFVKHTAPPTQGVALRISFQIFHSNYPPRSGPVTAQWQQTGEN